MSHKYDSVKKVLLKSLREGMPITYAFEYAGLNRQTYYVWKRNAESGNETYISILHDIKKAQSDFVQGRLDNIKKAADKGNWVASAWLLERMHKTEFARLEKIAETDPTGENEPTSVDDARRIVLDFIDKELARSRSNGTGKANNNGSAKVGGRSKKRAAG